MRHDLDIKSLSYLHQWYWIREWILLFFSVSIFLFFSLFLSLLSWMINIDEKAKNWSNFQCKNLLLIWTRKIIWNILKRLSIFPSYKKAIPQWRDIFVKMKKERKTKTKRRKYVIPFLLARTCNITQQIPTYLCVIIKKISVSKLLWNLELHKC